MFSRKWIVLTSAALGMLAGNLSAQRINSFSFDANLVASADDNPRVSGLPSVDTEQDELRFVFGFYPTIQFNSVGAGNNFNLFYGFGLQRVDTELDSDSESHAAGASWSGELGSSWEIDFQDFFRKSPDFTTLNEFRGIVFTPDGVFFDFERVAQSRDSYENTATINLRHRFGARSHLSFGGGHSIRQFSQSEFFVGRISDQQRFNGNLFYHHGLGARTEMRVGYDYQQWGFEDFSNARNHRGTLGMTHELVRDVNLDVWAGPSYVEATQTSASTTSVDAGMRIAKNIEDNIVSVSYRRRTGASSGIGSISRTDAVNFGFLRPLGRSTTLNIGVNGFRTRRQLDNPIETEGVQVSAFADFLLTETWGVTVGASYRDQDSNDQVFEFSRTQFWISLRFLLPEFWRSR